MKKIFKYTAIALIAGLTVNSCETVDLDLTADPNALTPSQANPDFFLNAAQESFTRAVETLGEIGAEVTRIENMTTRDYQNAYDPAGFDLIWDRSYAQTLQNLREMNVLAEEADLNYHIGMGQVMEAYIITELVDYFGPVPYSEAISAPEILTPNVDSGADIYADVLVLLDDAIANFNADSAALPQNDFFYDGNAAQWIRAANTLKLRLYKNTGDTAAFNAIISSGNFIQEVADDFQFRWGTNQVQPDVRHPDYANNYEVSGVGTDYQSIWLMELMRTSEDPRLRYYFYRQSPTVPGAPGIAPDEENLACSLTAAPPQYIAGGFAYCSLPDGFWGRNHGNDEGIPPDGFLRTAPGVYPIGGEFDDSTFDAISLTSGGGGAGVTPLLLASTVDFWRAELLMASNTDAAKAFILSGVEKSIAKVQSFGPLDSGADLSVAPTAGDNNTFVLNLSAAYDEAEDEDRWNILAEQFFIALKGNGHDAYNFYRRTGFPNDLEPNLEPDPGAFIRSFFYPANSANNNNFVEQKTTVTEQVFWDTNPAFPAFPPAN